MVIPERYVDIQAVSRYTSLAKSTLYEWAAQGKIPSIKVGSRRVFDLNEIDEMMESLKQVCLKEEETVNKIIGDLRGN